MRWSSLLLAAVLVATGAPEEKRISIYSTIANYSLPVTDREGREYVGLLEILEPLGTVGARQDRDRWRLRFNTIDAEFTPGRSRGKLRGRDVDLSAPFVLENGRGLVPVSSLSALMPTLLGGPVTLHEGSRRLFIGNVGLHFTAQMRRTNPPALVMEFSAPVNPTIATEPGKLRMVFTREPLVPPGTNSLTFGDKLISSATYSEANGSAEVAINSTTPLLASFSNDRRSITIAPVTQNVQSAAPNPGVQPTGTGSVPEPQGNAFTAAGNPSSRPFAIIDASHGGDERGAALTDQMAEKDVTLAIARRVRHELESRGLTATLLRDADSTLSLDQRASTVNAARPAVYICLHAASQGTGVRVYTAVLPTGENHGVFLDWNTAQSGFLSLSEATAASIGAELQKKQIPARQLGAPLRPLNNVATAAVAVEIAPPASGLADLNSQQFQDTVAAALAAGLAAAREKLEAAR